MCHNQVNDSGRVTDSRNTITDIQYIQETAHDLKFVMSKGRYALWLCQT